MYYNCTNGREFVSAAGLKKLGIETVPAIATRAVILDMVGLMGRDPVPEGTPFNRKEIDAALKRQGGMRINKGDKRYGSVEPGLGVDGANHLASLDVAMAGADTWGLEVVPFEDPKKVLYVHQTRSALRASPARCRRSSTRSSCTEKRVYLQTINNELSCMNYRA